VVATEVKVPELTRRSHRDALKPHRFAVAGRVVLLATAILLAGTWPFGPHSAAAEAPAGTVFGPAIVLDSELVAPPVVQLTVSPISRRVDTLALHKLQFRLPDTIPLPLDAGFRVTYPSGFGLESLLTVFYADSDGVEPNPAFRLPPLRNGQSADMFLDSTGVATVPGSTIVLNIVKLKNPQIRGSYQIALEVLARDSTLLFGPTLSAPFSIIAGEARTIVISPKIASVAAGRSQLFSAVVKDAFGNTIDTATVSYRVEPDSLGIQNGPVFTARRVGAGRVIARYGALEDTAGQVTVRPGSLARWEMHGLPPTATAGSPFTGAGVVLTARDAFGNLKFDYLDSLYFASVNSTALLPATQASPYFFTAADSGRHTFPAASFTLFKSGVDSVRAQGGGQQVVQAVAVSAAPGIVFQVSVPDTAIAGEAFAVTASGVRDRYDNVASASITLELSPGDSLSPSGQRPSLPTIQAAVGGGSVAARLYRAGRYPIRARLGDTLRVTDSVVVLPSDGRGFVFNIGSGQVSGVPLSSPAVLTAFDLFGNVASRYHQSGRTVAITAKNGDPVTRNSIPAGSFQAGVADLALWGVTYQGRGGLVQFVATDGIAAGTSDPVDFTALRVDTVRFDQTEVRRGVDVLTGSIEVALEGAGTVNITSLTLTTAYGSFALGSVAPSLPHSWTGPGTRAYDFSWPVDGGLPQACVAFGARVQASFGSAPAMAEFSGGPCVEIVSPADLQLVNLSPDTVAYAAVRYLAIVANEGVRGVTLELSSTRLIVAGGGKADTTESEHGGQSFVGPGDTVALAFVGAHLGAFGGDSAAATLQLRGFETGRPFAVDRVAPQPRRFRLPASLASVAGSVAPDTLLIGRADTLRLRVVNAGGVAIEAIRPESTWLELVGPADTARLPLAPALWSMSRLPAGRDTLLRFSLSQTQSRLAGGTYMGRFRLTGEQNNLRFAVQLALGEGVVFVGDAKARIDSVWVSAPNAPRVSTGQAFSVKAAVSNRGLEPLDSIRVQLSADGGALFTGQASIVTIPINEARVAEWSVTADFAPVPLETFSVALVRALGRYTNAPAQEVAPLDQQAAVQVQAPASVEVETRVYLPPEAADLRVAAGSEFQIAARFLNNGEAETGGGSLRVSVQGGLAVAESTVVTLPPAGETYWTLTAPTVATPVRIVVALEDTVFELNTALPAAVARVADTLDLEVVFEAPPLFVRDVRFEAGQIDFDFTPLAWNWSNDDPTGQFPILVRQLEVELRDGRSGALLDASSYLQDARLELPDDTVAADLAGGRLRFGTDSLRRIAPGTSEGISVSVRPKGGAEFSEFRFATRAALWTVVERSLNGAGLAVPVTDEVGDALDVESPLAFATGAGAANYPNPFRAGVEATRIVYTLAQDATVDIVLYSVDGREVWSRSFAAGSPGGSTGANQVTWDGRNDKGFVVLDGVYLARLKGGGLDVTLKLAVLK
jgi:hypothetical protein